MGEAVSVCQAVLREAAGGGRVHGIVRRGGRDFSAAHPGSH